MVVFLVKSNENTSPNGRALMKVYRVVPITKRESFVLGRTKGENYSQHPLHINVFTKWKVALSYNVCLYIIVKENMIFEGLHNVEFDFNFKIIQIWQLWCPLAIILHLQICVWPCIVQILKWIPYVFLFHEYMLLFTYLCLRINCVVPEITLKHKHSL